MPPPPIAPYMDDNGNAGGCRGALVVIFVFIASFAFVGMGFFFLSVYFALCFTVLVPAVLVAGVDNGMDGGMMTTY
jgi:hypothetical protein